MTAAHRLVAAVVSLRMHWGALVEFVWARRPCPRCRYSGRVHGRGNGRCPIASSGADLDSEVGDDGPAIVPVLGEDDLPGDGPDCVGLLCVYLTLLCAECRTGRAYLSRHL